MPAATAAAAPPLEPPAVFEVVPRVAGDAGERAVGDALPAELGRGGLADHHGVVLAQPGDRGRVDVPRLVRVDGVRAAQRRPAAVSRMSLIETGTPSSRPSRLARAASAPPTAAASASAASASTRQNALTASLTASMRSSASRATSTGDRLAGAVARPAARSRSARRSRGSSPGRTRAACPPRCAAARPSRYLVRLSWNSATSSDRQPTTSPDMCGETITFGRAHSGESAGSGSSANTSSAAPAMPAARPAPSTRSSCDDERPAPDVDQPRGRRQQRPGPPRRSCRGWRR